MQKAAELGCNSPHVHLPADATTAAGHRRGAGAQRRPAVDAMLVQYPAPPQVDFDAVLLAVDPDKDVDGMHPTNVGRLALGIPGPVSCTPAGHRGDARALRGPGRRPRRRDRRPRRHDRPAAEHPAVAEAARPPTPPSPSCTPACPTGPSTPGGPTSSIAAAGVPGMIQPEHIKPGGVVVGAGVQLRGPQAAARRRRGVRGGRRLDHAPRRRRRARRRSRCCSATSSRPPSATPAPA